MATHFFDELLKESAKPTVIPINPAGPSAAAGPVASDLLAQLRACAGPDERRARMVEFLSAEIRKVLGMDAGAALDASANLISLGMDSLMAVELRNRIKKNLGELGKRVPATLIFNYPTVTAMTAFLLKDVASEEALAAPTAKAA